MKILFKTVCYQGRGRDRFQHSSAVLPGKGGAGAVHRAPSHSWEVTEEGQPSQLIYVGQTGYRFLYLCRRVGQGADLPGGLNWPCGTKSGLTLQGFPRTVDQRGLGTDRFLRPLYVSSTTQPPGLLLKPPMPRPDPKTNEVGISGWDPCKGDPTVQPRLRTLECVSFQQEVCI